MQPGIYKHLEYYSAFCILLLVCKQFELKYNDFICLEIQPKLSSENECCLCYNHVFGSLFVQSKYYCPNTYSFNLYCL